MLFLTFFDRFYKLFFFTLEENPFIFFFFSFEEKIPCGQAMLLIETMLSGYPLEFLAKSQIWKFKHESTFLLACLTRLTAKQKFSYTLSFLLVPIPFFVYEFFTSRQLGTLAQKGREIVNQMAKCQSIMEFIGAYCR